MIHVADYYPAYTVLSCVQPPPNPHHAHHAKSQSPCICTLALKAPSCLVGALTMCPPPPINLQQHSTLHPHLHTHSEPSCTATFGCAHTYMFLHCLEDFSPQTSPSGTNFPNFQLLGTCADLHRPAFLPTWPFMAFAPPFAPFFAPPHTSVHLCTPLCTFPHPSAHLCAPLCNFLHFTFQG